MNDDLHHRHQYATEDEPRHHVPWERFLSRPFQYVMDLCVLTLAFLVAYQLRFEFEIPEFYSRAIPVQLPLAVLIQFAALNLVGVYSFVWRYVGMSEVKPFLKAAVWSVLPILVLRLLLPEHLGLLRMPISVIVTDTIFAFGGVLGLRVIRRSLYERYERKLHKENGFGETLPVLLVGAGKAGLLAAKEIQSRGDMNVKIVGFVDDAKTKQGTVIQGVRVIGTTHDLPRLVTEHHIDHVVITIVKASRTQIRRIVQICEQIPVKARIIPGLYEILSGDVEISRLQDLQIEDLLGRDQVHLDEEGVRGFLAGKTVMITGAGGSIGSELARQAARFGVGTLLLVERAEFALFDIDRELREARPDLSIVPLVANVSDETRMRPLFEAYRPAVVVHAAAHKHVPMMESNPCEAVSNNILATRLLGEIAGEFEAEAFIQISTDKAVNPTSVMGASKRVAELVVQDLNPRYSTHFISVRFGNVLGSAGSVIPIFKEQILKGGPVTVTDPEMTRYFMTIPEAAQLVLEAGAIGQGGEIFVLDMGEPVRILDMANEMIRLFNLRPNEDIEVVFTGVRPGEKLFEELAALDENHTRTRHPKIFIGTINTYPDRQVREALERFEELGVFGREKELRRFLNELLPEATITE